MKKHIKGHLLETLARNGRMWDYDLTDDVMQALGYSGDYWYDTARLTLTELYAGGLVSQSATDVDPSKSRGQERVLLHSNLTDFGRTRMAQAGLSLGDTGRDDS